VLILNDTPEPRHIAFRSDLSLWLPQAGEFEVKYFDAQGKLLRESSVAGTHFVAETDLLQPGEMGAVEVRAK